MSAHRISESWNVLKNAVSSGKNIAFSTSLGIEDQIITHLICSNSFPIEFFTLDTGRLFPETLKLLSETEKAYNLKIKVYTPVTEQVENYISINGINGFYDSKVQRRQCCEIRKVNSLKRALNGKDGWITGIRKEQSENRFHLTTEEIDQKFNIKKFHPLLNWKRELMLQYVIREGVLINPLHQKGYLSIGCAPCTRPIKKNENDRDGRWWWEKNSREKECGLHGK